MRRKRDSLRQEGLIVYEYTVKPDESARYLINFAPIGYEFFRLDRREARARVYFRRLKASKPLSRRRMQRKERAK